MKPLLSIVIPTKDRYEYLKCLIELLISFKSGEIEIIIQDNTYNNQEIIEYLATLQQDNLRYFHIKEQLPIYLNSDKAIRNSTGEYVCMLGDDDGTTDRIIEVVKWMKSNNIGAAITTPVYYNWPDSYSCKRAILKYKSGTGKFTIRYTRDILDKCMKDGFTWRDGLPGVYHGIVQKEILNRIYDKCGTYHPGPSPDIANCVSVCLTVEKYGLVDIPIVINGVGRNHGGGSLQKNIELRKLPFLPDNIITQWESQIPRAWTATTIWCESATKALRAMRREDLIKAVNYEYMYACFICLYFSHRNLAIKLSANNLSLTANLLFKLMRSLYKRIHTKIDHHRKEVHGIQNIREAVSFLSTL